MNKKLIITLALIGAISSSTFANITSTNSTIVGTNEKIKDLKNNFKENLKETRNKFKNQIKDAKSKFKGTKEKLKNEINEKRKIWKEKIKESFKKLDKETKKKLKLIKKEYLPQLKKLKEEFKTATKEQRQQIIGKAKQIREKMRLEIENATKGTDYEKSFRSKIEELKQLRENMKEQLQKQREQIKQIRKEFKESRQDLIVKWKKLIYEKLMGKIDKMSLIKLEKINKRIDKAVEKIKNGKLTEDRKVKIISALDALKQVIEEKITKLKTEGQNLETELNTINEVLGN